MKFKSSKNNQPPIDAGFTLVELVVSAVIIGIAIMAVVAVARKGRELDITYSHHRRARAIIDSCFESVAYQYTNYAALPTITGQLVKIDPRGDGPDDDLNGSLTMTVSPPTTIGGVECKQISATVSWAEPEETKSITVEKWVTQIQ